ncbi:hypothetical protein [Marinifilum breve]|nr:hypothetical protein [Marinifilum breve]
MNKLFYGLAIVLLMLSCSGSDSPVVEEELKPSNEFEELLDEYNLFNTGAQFESGKIGLDTNNIYFNGRIKDKLIIKGFNKKDKSLIFSHEEIKLDTIINIDEGYGVSSTHSISDFLIRHIHKSEDNYVLLLWGMANGDQYLMNRQSLTSHLYLISDKNYNSIKSFSIPASSFYFTGVTPWFNNSIIVSSTTLHVDYKKWTCYTLDGINQFETSNFNVSKYYTPISLEDCIAFRNNFYRINVKTNKILWESENPLSDLPSDIRKDVIVFSQPKDGYVNCEIKYTQKDGKRGERTYKVSIATGDFTMVE